MKIDIKQMGKAALPFVALACGVVANIINNKQTEDAINKKVAEALANQAKES